MPSRSAMPIANVVVVIPTISGILLNILTPNVSTSTDGCSTLTLSASSWRVVRSVTCLVQIDPFWKRQIIRPWQHWSEDYFLQDCCRHKVGLAATASIRPAFDVHTVRDQFTPSDEVDGIQLHLLQKERFTECLLSSIFTYSSVTLGLGLAICTLRSTIRCDETNYSNPASKIV